MPLLNKKNFVINDPPPNLKDDEEVFYSELTNEIFRDYEEFCERIFLCNSLVWSCSYTGRSSLTYQEAIDSELVAKKMLNEFPLKLRIPVLYLTTLTERSSLLEFAEDVFAFARDRYFIGEEVEVCFSNDTWSDCRIVKVQYPSQKRLQEHNQLSQKTATKSGERDYWPPAALYSYEVEPVAATGDGTRHCVAADKVRRRKNVYTREKNRLYIKQFVERQASVWKLKKSVYHKYGIDKVKFDMIFCGPAMASLAPTKKKPAIKKPAVKEAVKKDVKKQKVQGSIDKYFAKQKSGDKQENGGAGDNAKKATPRKPAETPQKTLVQKLKNKYKMNNKNAKLLKTVKENKTEKVPRERKKKEKAVRKALSKEELQKIAVECKDKDVKEKFALFKKNNLTKEEKVQVLEFVKEYTKFREDLECSSLKELPAPLPVQMRIPNELFGDFLHMLEFFNSFSNVVNVRDFFLNGITFELLERALVEKEVAGPLSDVIHVLLSTLFELQDQDEEYDDKLSLDSGSEPTPVQQSDKKADDALINYRLAVAAAAYSQQYHGHPISELTLDSASLTEVLRLHIISSGRRLIDDSDQSRRIPSLNIEDPCSELCLRHPQLLNALSQKSIFELPIEDKVLIINSLINQILSFASTKESIEEELVNLRLARVDWRSKRAAEVKRIKEAEKELKEQQKAASGENKDKSKSDKEATEKKEKEEATGGDGEGGEGEVPKTRMRMGKNLVLKARELAQLELRVQCLPLGVDRAFRRYWLFYSTPGLYVEHNEPNPGVCVPRDIIDSLSADSPVKYVRRLFDEGSDKENVGKATATATSRGSISAPSPSKKPLLAEKNGDAVSSSPARVKVEAGAEETASKWNLMCTGDAALCPVHARGPTTTWSFYRDEADLNALIDSLNKYGVRESQLRKELIKNKPRILDSVKRCPHAKLNPTVPEDPDQLEIKKSVKTKYLNAHLDFPPDTPLDEILISSLRFMILETEDKIDAGHIGTLKVKDRHAWREALNNKSYDKQCDELSWGPKKGKNLIEVPSDESDDKKEVANSTSQSSSASDCIERLMRTDVESPKKEVFDLACAILQIEQAIEHRFLKKPFGVADCKEKEKEKAETEGYKLRERWELSLMASCSISQLFVHIYTLDYHIAWSRSALKASCRICRRSSNPESMLLCDMCNKGHHLHCLKPPLKKVPEGDWYCPSCCPKPSPVKRSRKEKMDADESDLDDCKTLGNCKACKSEGWLVTCSSCECGWHLECINPPLRKQPRSKWNCHGCRRQSKSGSGAVNGDDAEREEGSRRRSRRSVEAAGSGADMNGCSVLRSDLPLDNAALQEMLDALMHHKDAWPFLRPVTKAEVPDYRNIIKKPMDFGTIKHKLNMLEYSKNSQVIADALLVFDNCYTYNQPDSEVYKTGERLQKMFEKLCSERKMNIDVDYEVKPPNQKKPKLM
ncbi:bromodomain adjacent to zinc finger domain protein 1A isoform X2 [Nilaparvata lugens]|uniref:bromodomain adjacent to zinc finger domain protein 1A isoform X2 n=1 Tax=Nilaparvata lugens TaxID=108931 RepID=UPI00193CAF99|nr:bromodomain adjacent to zinc finger domain protein 1A isoform X2 [Nilaparvata lugens]